jgi:hypothetical protein
LVRRRGIRGRCSVERIGRRALDLVDGIGRPAVTCCVREEVVGIYVQLDWPGVIWTLTTERERKVVPEKELVSRVLCRCSVVGVYDAIILSQAMIELFQARPFKISIDADERRLTVAATQEILALSLFYASYDA